MRLVQGPVFLPEAQALPQQDTAKDTTSFLQSAFEYLLFLLGDGFPVSHHLSSGEVLKHGQGGWNRVWFGGRCFYFSRRHQLHFTLLLDAELTFNLLWLPDSL